MPYDLVHRGVGLRFVFLHQGLYGPVGKPVSSTQSGTSLLSAFREFSGIVVESESHAADVSERAAALDQQVSLETSS